MAARQGTSQDAGVRRKASAETVAEAARRSAQRNEQRGLRRRERSAFFAEIEGEPQSLEQAIESERGRLSAAQAVLRCLHSALLYSEASNKHATSYAEVTSIALRLVREAVYRLDSVHLKPFVEARRQGAGRRNGKPVTPRK